MQRIIATCGLPHYSWWPGLFHVAFEWSHLVSRKGVVFMQHTIFVATIATALLSSSLSVQAQSIRPEPIALPASEFPVPSATLHALITAENFTALRAHAWTLWSGVTADSTQTFKGAVLPIGKPGCQNGKSLPRLASRWHATLRGVFFSRSVARGSSTILSAKERGLPRSNPQWDLADPQIFGGQTKTDFVWAIQSGAK